ANRRGQRRPSLPGRAFLPVNGEKEAGRNAGTLLATMAIDEIGSDSALLPVYGEKMAAAR
ncbi:hypothetical protein, partial [Mesorhizobium sp.]|uniref:hypothetical protein n=1 Tax=Mesorhizobium sp. TaxID=1871066 RepID=UPI0025BF279C